MSEAAAAAPQRSGKRCNGCRTGSSSAARGVLGCEPRCRGCWATQGRPMGWPSVAGVPLSRATGRVAASSQQPARARCGAAPHDGLADALAGCRFECHVQSAAASGALWAVANTNAAGAVRLLEAYGACMCIYMTRASSLAGRGAPETARRRVSTGRRREMTCAQHE